MGRSELAEELNSWSKCCRCFAARLEQSLPQSMSPCSLSCYSQPQILEEIVAECCDSLTCLGVLLAATHLHLSLANYVNGMRPCLLLASGKFARFQWNLRMLSASFTGYSWGRTSFRCLSRHRCNHSIDWYLTGCKSSIPPPVLSTWDTLSDFQCLGSRCFLGCSLASYQSSLRLSLRSTTASSPEQTCHLVSSMRFRAFRVATAHLYQVFSSNEERSVKFVKTKSPSRLLEIRL